MSGISWQRTGDKRVWVAAAGGMLLTVTRLTSGQWAATVDGNGAGERSPEFGTRVAAQKWAEHHAGGAR